MELQGVNASGTTGASLEVKALQLAKSDQEAKGQATLQLLESAADVPKVSSDPAIGQNVNTFA
ncbi:hypothetical protein OAP14_06080 [Aliiglaciecola sp.]|nr:hypothetical protein [Aliiglaciecola sp.]|eukprot:CAMPEP_0184444582 /NCGR_PEP_ID=MMETSP0740-20130409/1475_1 /TAXON_ID=385413 /ORGANISM="Thalassiosira miniscula, Strain CCMP1093" /LENGTH=62 /DNA_ID=CAMNT_0026813365 /DNA_START=37 /DNA_END=225 /DNA_ORIENTATION=-